MFRNPFGRVRSSCSARRFRPENWTERHELSRASFSNRWHCGQNCGQNQMRPVHKQKNPTISNVKSLDLWSEWRESNSRPLEPHCASLENTMYNPILPRLSIVKFQIYYIILFHWMSRRFIPFVVKLWSNDPDK